MTFSVSKVIFDLDGTLVDTAPDLTAALNYVLAEAGFKAVDPDIFKHIVGQGAIAMIKKGLALQDEPNSVNPKSLHAKFLEHYTSHVADTSKTYDGCIDLLDHLKAMDFPLAICTNKPIKLALSLLEKLKIDHYFGAICGGDSFDFNKPDPRHLIETSALLPSEGTSVMIGDSIHDIDAAKAANFPSIGVSYGYSSIDMDQLEPTKVVHSLAEIKALITR